MASTKAKSNGNRAKGKIVKIELPQVPTGEELLRRLRRLAADWEYAIGMDRVGVAPVQMNRAAGVTIFEQMHAVLQLLDAAISPQGDPRPRVCLAKLHSLASACAAPTVLELSNQLRDLAARHLERERGRGPDAEQVMQALLESTIVEIIWKHPKMPGDRTLFEVRELALKRARGFDAKARKPEAYASAIFAACGYRGRLFHS